MKIKFYAIKYRLLPLLLKSLHPKTSFTIEVLIEILAERSCMIDLFCKSMAASNF